MKKISILLTLSLVLLSLCACVPQQDTRQRSVYAQKNYTVETSQSTYSDKDFSISITPVMENSAYRAFNLSIENKTKNELKIVWNDTYFLESEEAKGGFMFEGIQYAQRNAPKQDMLILPNTTVTKRIYPNEKVMFLRYDSLAASMGLPSGWIHAVLENNIFGAYIKVKGNKIEKSVKLLTSIYISN